jgi:WD40 repeat protein
MVAKGEYHFLSGGSKIVSLWKIEGSSLSKKQARAGKKAASSSTASIAYLSMANLDMKGVWKVVLGTSTGDLLTLEDKDMVVQADKAHAKAIFALAECESSSILISGGKDCFIKIWNQALQMISSLDLQSSTTFHSFDPIVLSLDIQPVEQDSSSTNDTLYVLIGLVGGEVVELSVPGTSKGASKESGDRLNYDLTKAISHMVVSSHCKGELWGLAPHPLDPDIFATVGDDATLRVWSVKKHVCLQATSLPRAARCVAWHPLGNILAVGLEEDKKSNQKLKKGKSQSKAGKKAASTSKASAKKPFDAHEEIEEEDDIDMMLDSVARSFDADGGVQIYSFRAPTPSLAAELVLRAVGCFPASHPKGSFVSVSDLKFAPNGDHLYVASHDCKLRGYTLPSMLSGDIFSKDFHWDEYNTILGQTPAFIFDKHSSTITHFDCTIDGMYLQSNDLGNELLFYDLSKRKQEPSASKLADYNGQLDDNEGYEGKLWASQTCVFGWSVQGIWPPNSYDSSEINAVDRHHSSKLLATGEDSGKIRILRFPSVIPSSQSVDLFGHASHVTSVRWSIGATLLSVGGNDKCVFVWEMHEK